MIYPVVLAGQADGAEHAAVGDFPAHFFSDSPIESRFQSVLRCLDHPMFEAPTVVTCEAYRFLAAEQMEAVGAEGALLIEPCQSKSAAALAAVALRFQADPDAMLLILPADHACGSEGALLAALDAAAPAAERGCLVTLAVQDSGAARGSGCLTPLSRWQVGASVQTLFSPVEQISNFAQGTLYNSGIYLVRAGSLLAAFKRHAPRFLQSIKAAVAGIRETAEFERLAPLAYGRVKQDSFETAILARMEVVVSVQVNPGWSAWSEWTKDAADERTSLPVFAGQLRRPNEQFAS